MAIFNPGHTELFAKTYFKKNQSIILTFQFTFSLSRCPVWGSSFVSILRNRGMVDIEDATLFEGYRNLGTWLLWGKKLNGKTLASHFPGVSCMWRGRHCGLRGRGPRCPECLGERITGDWLPNLPPIALHTDSLSGCAKYSSFSPASGSLYLSYYEFWTEKKMYFKSHIILIFLSLRYRQYIDSELIVSGAWCLVSSTWFIYTSSHINKNISLKLSSPGLVEDSPSPWAAISHSPTGTVL